MAGNRLLTKVLQRYWRLSRSLTMGAQALVLDAQDRVLLVRHGYQPGWHLPGGGVEKGETAAEAMRRELLEETGVVPEGAPQLVGVYANFASFPNDHVVLYLVRAWRQGHVPPPGREILEQRFFRCDSLPADVNPPARRRIAEVLGGGPRQERW
jgi:ADP-ribose pyrophosphatase YjhB (NUDIX family)